MAKTKPASGLTIDQIDGLSMEIGRALALTNVLHDNSDDNDEACAYLFPMLVESLKKVGNMVEDCKIGGRK